MNSKTIRLLDILLDNGWGIRFEPQREWLIGGSAVVVGMIVLVSREGMSVETRGADINDAMAQIAVSLRAVLKELEGGK